MGLDQGNPLAGEGRCLSWAWTIISIMRNTSKDVGLAPDYEKALKSPEIRGAEK